MIVALSLLACLRDSYQAPEPRPVVPGGPVAGAAEGYLKLPIGTPLSGYSSRCTCLGGDSYQDDRQSHYNVSFVESTGIQTYPTIKVIWLENGDDHLVLTKTDTIYSFDGLVQALTERLEAETGLELDDRVMHTTNHSHASFGTFSDQATFYLGSDKYHEENFQRFVEQVVQVALAAREGREPVQLGLSWHDNWDAEDRVYADRRGENDEIVLPADLPYQPGKDPRAGVLRIDRLDGSPKAVMVNFGMHGTVLGGDNPLVSSESGGAVEISLQERFDEPVVVMYTQGAGGDQTPSSEDRDFAAVESVGERAADLLLDLWAATPVGSAPIRLMSAARSVPQHPSQIRVTRDGTVDWRYEPYREGATGDGEVYGPDGLPTTFDEFVTQYGLVFCGTGDLDLPVGRLATDVWPYTNCIDAELVSRLLLVFFQIPEEELPLPLPESLGAGTALSRVGPLLTRFPDGEEREAEVLFGFFPGEPTSLYTQHFRARALRELGFESAMMVGYSQDHEGYLLLPEDWLLAGYEPDIGLWGPLQAEHLMERTLEYGDELLLGDVHLPSDPLGRYQPPDYLERPLPELTLDATPEAGRRLTELPAEGLWAPLGMSPDLTFDPVVPRVQGLRFLAWEGGDPAVDEVVAVLERKEGGAFQPVLSRSGRPITSDGHDFLLAYTPHPLYPVTGPQVHRYLLAWQAVGHVLDRDALPLGTYRLRVTGQRLAGGELTWPRTTAAYEVLSPEFEVVPGVLSVTPAGEGLSVSLPAPTQGFRLVALGGSSVGDNPIRLPATVEVESPAGSETLVVEAGAVEAGRTVLDLELPPGWTRVVVTDAAGNQGEGVP